MFTRFIAGITLIVIVYLSLIFLAPSFIDTYGFTSFNEKVRMVKRAAELDRTISSTGSIVEKATDIAKPYIDESKNLVNETKDTINNVNTIVTEKTEQAKEAAKTAQDAYKKATEAKDQFEKLSNFGTGQ